MKYVAQYKDCAGNSFSAPVAKLSTGQWALTTASGPREISFYIHGNDVAGGFATFQDFRLDDVPEGLRGCDFIELRKRMYESLPWPQKPASAPTPIPQSETRVHLEERLPGESRLGQLQRSVGRKELQARADRQREFQEQVSQAQPDARQLAAATEIRRLNNFHARQMRPRGFGGGFIVEP